MSSSRKNKEPIKLDHKTKAVFDRKGYEVKDKISEGSFGKVYKAKRTKDGQMTAVKVIDLEALKEKAAQKDKDLLDREIETLTKLKHKNVLNVHDIFKSKGKVSWLFSCAGIIVLHLQIYIFMEFAPNGSIADKIKKMERIPEDEAKKWFKQTVDALHYMHKDTKLCHRDIKPENILLDKDDNAKLTDFGFTKAIDRDSTKHTILGTKPYMSPELFMGKGYEQIPVDSWAMGVTLYEMVTGKWPFPNPKDKRRTVKEMETSAYRKTKEFKNLDEEVQDLIDRLLVFNPKHRLNMNGALEHSYINPTTSLKQFKKKFGSVPDS